MHTLAVLGIEFPIRVSGWISNPADASTTKYDPFSADGLSQGGWRATISASRQVCRASRVDETRRIDGRLFHSTTGPVERPPSATKRAVIRCSACPTCCAGGRFLNLPDRLTGRAAEPGRCLCRRIWTPDFGSGWPKHHRGVHSG